MALICSGLIFRDLPIAPLYGGLYLAVRGRVIVYAGEGKNIFNRVSDSDHEGIERAERLGANQLLFSGPVSDRNKRLDFETIIRREYSPVANLQPTPSWQASAEAAERLGISALARDFWSKSMPAPGLEQTRRLLSGLPKTKNALAGHLPTDSMNSHYLRKNALSGGTIPGGPPRNVIADALFGLGVTERK